MLGFVRTDNQPLVWCLRDPQRAVAAYHELLRRGKDATSAIRAGLHHQNPAVREGCCRLLDHLVDTDSMSQLMAMTDDPDGLRPGPEPGRPEEGRLAHARRRDLPADHPTHAQITGQPLIKPPVTGHQKQQGCNAAARGMRSRQLRPAAARHRRHSTPLPSRQAEGFSGYRG
jgi:hypothetical protein